MAAAGQGSADTGAAFTRLARRDGDMTLRIHDGVAAGIGERALQEPGGRAVLRRPFRRRSRLREGRARHQNHDTDKDQMPVHARSPIFSLSQPCAVFCDAGAE